MQHELYLIRHGESRQNLTPELINGQSNFSRLTQEGAYQSFKLGQLLARESLMPDVVIASGAERTVQTAEIAMTVLGLDEQILIDQRFLELSQGRFEGMPRKEVYTKELETLRKQQQKDFKLDGGESMNEVAFRVGQAISDLNKIYLSDESESAKKIFVFTHGLAKRSFIGSMLGWSAEQIYRTPTPYTSITKLVLDGIGQWQLDYFARDHLLELTV